jgi:hypothetical protein
MLFGKYWLTQKLSKPSAARSSRSFRLPESLDSKARAWREALEIRFDTTSVEAPTARPMAERLSQETRRQARFS